MGEPTKKRTSGRVGCLAAVALTVGAVVGVGAWLGSRDSAAKAPCERYATDLLRALDHCYSGVTRDHTHHVQLCEQSLNPTSACLDHLLSLSCDDLERAASVPPTICRR